MKRYYVLAAVLVTLGTAAVSVVLYPHLPAEIPTHWNIHGEVNDYSSRAFGAFFAPAMSLAIIALFAVLPWLSPGKFKVDSFRNIFDRVLLIFVIFLCYVHVIVMFVSLGYKIDMNRAMLGGIFLLLAFIGNILGKVRRNFWIGIRTPWTLANERVWYDTHRFAARVFVVVGLAGFILVIAGLGPAIAVGLIIGAAMVSAIYSLIDYKSLEKQGKL